MKQKKKSDVAVLLGYAGSHKGLTFLGLALSAVSMLLSMAPYICIWLAARDLIAVAPDWTKAQSVAQYGWLAFAFAVAGIILYFAGLMCTHLAAFRTASNIRKQGVAHVMKAPLGFFDSNASGSGTVSRPWDIPSRWPPPPISSSRYCPMRRWQSSRRWAMNLRPTTRWMRTTPASVW